MPELLVEAKQLNQQYPGPQKKAARLKKPMQCLAVELGQLALIREQAF